MAGNMIFHSTVVNGVTVKSSSSYTTSALDLERLAWNIQGPAQGYFSLYAHMSTGGGGGKCTVRYQMSNDGANYVRPIGSTAIITGLTTTTGPGSDGKVFTQFTPAFGRFMRLQLNNTSTAHVKITAILACK